MFTTIYVKEDYNIWKYSQLFMSRRIIPAKVRKINSMSATIYVKEDYNIWKYSQLFMSRRIIPAKVRKINSMSGFQSAICNQWTLMVDRCYLYLRSDSR